MSEKNFGESKKVEKIDEQMTEKELEELLNREIPEGEEMPEVSGDALEEAKKIANARDIESPQG